MKKEKRKKKHKENIIRKKSPYWFYIVLTLIPILFFVLLECSLRIFNYGKNFDVWVEITRDKYILNPEIGYKYFHNVTSVPVSNQNSFDIVKKENAFRIFILGGSSAAGYPFQPNGDFGKYIQKRLELLYPDKTIEVVNLAMTAINSYTLRDLTPALLNEKPDLILIYAGHNEYYGALGVGSMESLGKTRNIVNFSIYLQSFKIVQLFTNTIKAISKIFAHENIQDVSGGTLMKRMVEDKMIPLNSEVYKDGIEQFKTNLFDILQMAKEAKVPVILGRLTFNLKDQAPFISIKTKQYPKAKDIYKLAKIFVEKNQKTIADSLFRFAKDLDALKFRAPEAINSIITKLGAQFNYPVIPFDTLFNKNSPQGIVGNNLIVDHLHPTLNGYYLIGKSFFDKIIEENILPKTNSKKIPVEVQDSLTITKIHFSKLDSTIAKYRILILKNDWPFGKKKSTNYMMRLFNASDYIDSLALKVVGNNINWEKAHRDAASWYLRNKNYDDYAYELNVLIDQYPFISNYSEAASKDLLSEHQYNKAYQFLLNIFLNKPDAFSTKWLGIIDLSQDKYKSAIKYLEKSLHYSDSDPQVLFNLSGAYSKTQKFDLALAKINRCLEINPNFPQAKALQNQLKQILKK